MAVVKKVFHSNCGRIHEALSSSTKSTPPTGAYATQRVRSLGYCDDVL